MGHAIDPLAPSVQPAGRLAKPGTICDIHLRPKVSQDGSQRFGNAFGKSLSPGANATRHVWLGRSLALPAAAFLFGGAAHLFQGFALVGSQAQPLENATSTKLRHKENFPIAQL